MSILVDFCIAPSHAHIKLLINVYPANGLRDLLLLHWLGGLHIWRPQGILDNS